MDMSVESSVEYNGGVKICPLWMTSFPHLGPGLCKFKKATLILVAFQSYRKER